FETAVKSSALEAKDALGRDWSKFHPQNPTGRPQSGAQKKNGAEKGAQQKDMPMTPPPPSVPPAGGMGVGGAMPKAEAKEPPPERQERDGRSDDKERAKKQALTPEGLRAGAGFSGGDNAATYFEDRRAGGRGPRQLYRRLDPTQEWAENNYHHLPVQQQVAAL